MLRKLFLVAAFSALAVLSATSTALAGGAERVVVLYHPDCPICVREAEILPGIAKQYPDISFTLIVLHEEGVAARKPKVRSSAANLQVSVAEGKMKDVMRRYGNEWQALPYTVSYNKTGDICGVNFGLLGPDMVGKWANAKC